MDEKMVRVAEMAEQLRWHLERATLSLKRLEVEIARADEQAAAEPRAATVTGEIPIVRGADQDGYGGEVVGKLDISDSILKGEKA